MVSPKSAHRATRAGFVSYLVPALVLGLVIVGPAFSQEFQLAVTLPEVDLTWQSEFESAVTLDTPLDVSAWSYGLSHDASELEVLGVELGAAAAALNGDTGPEYNVLNDAPIDGTGVTHAAVASLESASVLAPGTDLELARVRYRVLVNPADAIPCEAVEVTIAFTDELRNDTETPPVRTLVTVSGESVIPAQVAGAISVVCPGTVFFTQCDGDTSSVSLAWDFGLPPEWDFLFLYRDGEFRAVLPIDATSFVDEDLPGGQFEYTLLTFVVDDPTNPSLLFARCVGSVVPVSIASVSASTGNWLGGETLTITGTTFVNDGTTSLAFVADGEPDLPLEVIEVTSSTVLIARTPEAPRLGPYSLRIDGSTGSAMLDDAFAFGFTRGEVNSQPIIDLSDAVALLDFLFVGGTPSPRCSDSADVNDDGTLDIADATSLLAYLFQGGDAPPAPHAVAGEDPTVGDDLECLE